MPRRSKRVPKGLHAAEIGEGGVDQDGGGHNIDTAAVGNSDRHVVGEEVQSNKIMTPIDGHNTSDKQEW